MPVTGHRCAFDGQDEVYLARGVQAWNLSHQIDDYADTDYVRIENATEIRVLNQHGAIDAQRTRWHMVRRSVTTWLPG